MIELHSWPTPNGLKISIFLEEAGLEHKVFPVNIGKSQQFDPFFLSFSPNNRIPAIRDLAPADRGEPITVFESGAILLYGIPRVVIGENRTFMGEEALLRGRGVELTVIDDARCVTLMREFIAAKPELWNEDIGE